MIQMNPPMKQKQNQEEKRLVVAKQEGHGRRMDCEFGISRCELVHTD